MAVDMGWHEHDQNVVTGCEQFFRPGYIANLIPSWIPATETPFNLVYEVRP